MRSHYLRHTADTRTEPQTATRSPQHSVTRIVVGIGCVLGALGLWLWQGSYFALAAVGYLPIVVIKIIAGDMTITQLSALWSWLMVKSILVILGGLALIVVAARVWPGRGPLAGMTDRRLHRVTVALVAVAAAVPTGYALTRLAWVAGLPLGVSPEFLEEIRPIVVNGLGLALMALLGALLTVGLVCRWGEVFPRWIPLLGGRRVPIGFAVNFALGVSLLVMVAGLFFVRAMIQGAGITGAPSFADQQPAAWLPEMFWPLWALALAGAALAYRERRHRAEPAGWPPPPATP